MSLKGKNIFITGGAGFIGSHIVDAVCDLGANVTVYDNFSFGSHQNIAHIASDIRVIEGDILDKEKLTKAMKGADIVSHQAAQLEIFKSSYDPFYDLEINTLGTLNVLNAAYQNNVKKVINASSACVYGQPVTKKQSEDHPTNPNWAYGVSKLAAEKYCQIFTEKYKIPVVSLRYGIVYGEREWYRRVLTIFVKRAILEQNLIIFGDGMQFRDFVYVKDLAEMNIMCMSKDVGDSEVFNVGTGKMTTMVDLANMLIQLTSGKIKIVHENTPEGEMSKLVEGKRRNPQELTGMRLDCTKALKHVGWSAKTSLIDGLKNEYEWAKDNLKRWQTIHYTK